MRVGRVDVRTHTFVGRHVVSKTTMKSQLRNMLGRFNEDKNCLGLIF